LIVTGGKREGPDPSITAPISFKGSITRSIGRLFNESSPNKVVSNPVFDKRPINKRIVVPELQTFIVSVDDDKPSNPFPSTVITCPSSSIETPKDSKACTVLIQSCARKKFLMMVFP